MWVRRCSAVALILITISGCGTSDKPSTSDASADATTSDTTAVDVTAADLDASAPELPNDGDVEDLTTSVTTLFVAYRADGLPGSGTEADPYGDLQVAIDAAEEGFTLQIGPGTFSAVAADYHDPGCGNCDDFTWANGADATVGFVIQGKSLQLLGAGQDQTILVTNAGYGVFFDDAGDSSVRSLRITGGLRDADQDATDAGIVVRDTALLVEDVAVVENDNLYLGPEPDPVVGVGGIFGREGSVITVRNCRVEDNSWDGITLYRGRPGEPESAPQATIENTRVGCTSGCVQPRGRGVGIAATWDSTLTAKGNVVHHYWKGIGGFGDSKVYLYNNVVEDQHGWGVIASGNCTMQAMNNIVTRSGTTGMAAWNASARGSFVNNIVAFNGHSPDEWVGKKTGIWFNAHPALFTLSHNLVYMNNDFDVCTGGLPNETPCVENNIFDSNGNLNVDPEFVSPTDYHLQPTSPAINAGLEDILDKDGSRSDMGVYGGPYAPEDLP
jgi:hypothetical protein